jgi:hypothetical protein
MTMRVTMRDPRRSEDGLSILLTGQTYTVSDDYGKFLVSLGAVDTDNVIESSRVVLRDNLLADEAVAARSLVANVGNLLANGKPGQPAVFSRKLTNSGGRLLMGGQDYRGIFVNAHDLLTNLLAGGTAYQTDIASIASYGVKLIRVSLGDVASSANWVTYIGTSGTSPAANLLSNLRLFLDECAKNGMGVILSLFWTPSVVSAALSSTVADYLTAGTTSRNYMKALAGTIAANFYKHPSLAAYDVGNEWFNLGSIAQFASATTNTGIDHFGAIAATCNDIIDGIRVYDVDRAVISPSGNSGRYEGGQMQEVLAKLIRAAGRCDVVGWHLYPDTNRAGGGYTHVFVGDDLGGSDIFLPAIRAAALQQGKAAIIGECSADDDETTYSGKPIGAVSLTSWQKAHAAGYELIGDWSWYADAPNVKPDLKTTRRAVMTQIAAYVPPAAGFIPPPQPLPTPGEFPVPAMCARGTAVTNAWVKIPKSEDLSPSPAANAKMAWMFWLRKRSAFGTGPRIISNDDGTNGYILTLNSNEGLTMQLCLGAAYNTNTTLSQFTYPTNLEADATKAYVNDWHHIAMLWDGSVNTIAGGGDDKQHFTIWVDGVVVGRIGYTSKQAAGYTTRDTYLLSNSDGSGALATADIFDVMVGKGFTLTSQQVADYMRCGIVPSGMQHRWKLNGGTADSIGTLHAVAGSGLTYVNNGVGNQT